MGTVVIFIDLKVLLEVIKKSDPEEHALSLLGPKGSGSQGYWGDNRE